MKIIQLGIPLWDYHKNAAKEFYIKANIPQIYVVEGSQSFLGLVTTCGVFVQQKFDEGKDYEISYQSNNSRCNVKVYEIKQNDAGIIEKILVYLPIGKKLILRKLIVFDIDPLVVLMYQIVFGDMKIDVRG